MSPAPYLKYPIEYIFSKSSKLYFYYFEPSPPLQLTSNVIGIAQILLRPKIVLNILPYIGI